MTLDSWESNEGIANMAKEKPPGWSAFNRLAKRLVKIDKASAPAKPPRKRKKSKHR